MDSRINFFQQNKKELKLAVQELVLSTEPRIIATLVFNSYASLSRGYTALGRLHKKIDRKLFGKHFYKTGTKKRTYFTAFPEHIGTNLHYHMLLRPQEQFVDKVVQIAPTIWKQICPQGNMKLTTLKSEDDVRAVSFYSTKDCFKEENFENFIISSQFL